MIHPCVRELHRSDSRGLHRLCDEGIDIFEFRGCNLKIHPAHNVHGIDHSLPVEGHIVIRLNVEIITHHPEGLLGPALKIGFIEFMVLTLFINLYKGIAENAADADIPCLFIEAHQHVDIGERTFSEVTVPGVHAKHRDCIEAGLVRLLTEQECLASPDNQKSTEEADQDQKGISFFSLDGRGLAFFRLPLRSACRFPRHLFLLVARFTHPFSFCESSHRNLFRRFFDFLLRCFLRFR